MIAPNGLEIFICTFKDWQQQKGQLMFDILNIWNNTNKSITGEQNLNAFKRKILEEQNRFSKCEKTNCYSCK